MKLNKTILATLTLSTLMLNSCGLYTKYKSSPVSQEIAGEGIQIPEEAAVALPTWNEVFTDAHLQRLITLALAQNADLRIASLNVSQAQRMLTTSKLAYAPSFALSPEGGLSKLEGQRRTLTYNLPVTASWEIDLFGKLRNNKQMAKAAFEGSQSAEKLVQTQLIAGVATNYYSLLLADQQLEYTRDSYKILEESVKAIEALQQVGIQTQAAVLQAQGNLQQLDLSLTTLEQQVKLLENNLCLLLNEAPHKIQRGKLNETAIHNPIDQSISLVSLSNRPDVQIAESTLAQSFYGVNHARASLYPSIRLGGSAGWTNNAGVIIDPAQWLFGAIASVTQPLFMAGQNRANLNNRKDQYSQQLISFEQTLLQAGKEVNDALIGREVAIKQTSVAANQVAIYLQAVETTRALMESGQSNYLEVLTAQSSYLASRTNQAAVWHNHAISQINLFKALGGGQ